MKRMSQEEANDLHTLIAEALDRLTAIENDIKSLVMESEQKHNPFSRTIRTALAAINPETQFETIKKARASLRLIDAKLEIEEFSNSDAEEIYRVLDDLKVLGQQIRSASQTYQARVRQAAETN